MAEELGKIEKPPVEGFKKGRKLFFVPLVFDSPDPPEGYVEKFNRYWEQAEKQIADLVLKLGAVNHIYHELIPQPGEAGSKAIGELNERSHHIVSVYLDKQATLEALEESDVLTEFMDWNRCLLMGLQNPKVMAKVYEFCLSAGKKRNEAIARRIDTSLQTDEIGLLLMRESHQIQFPPDIQVFYVAPPALDEIKRWLREREQEPGKTEKAGQD
jgi:hypothetical protein